MRVLLLHPEDSPLRGPWSGQRWDLVVDLGASTPFSRERWEQQYGCAFLCADSFRQGVADAKPVREIFSAGRGWLIDEEGIDHWDLTSIALVQDAATILQLRRVAQEIPRSAELWCSRSGWRGHVLTLLLDRPARNFGRNRFTRALAGVSHYAAVARRFSAAQIKEIFLDKYDSGYRWRSRFAVRQERCTQPVVLIPSAYENVSRMAAAYAAILPAQPFLTVGTRRSAWRFVPPPNVEVRDLAAYATSEPPPAEVVSLLKSWARLKASLQSSEVLRWMFEAGILDPFSGWLEDNLRARNAWNEVLTREPVCGLLCGDDSNRVTRLPVLLAARRKIPTVDFHHGALDGRYLFKDLPSDVYLAKNEMERDYLLRVCGLAADRVVIAPPRAAKISADRPPTGREGTFVVLFSEPYEGAGLRAEEVYGELLPALWRVAREHGRDLVVKLHPFESRSERSRMVRNALPADADGHVRVVDGPITNALMEQAWFGITIESTTVIDCLQSGISCFLCRWLTISPYEYQQQYIRFGIGEMLDNAGQIAHIPRRLAEVSGRPAPSMRGNSTDPAVLRRWLTGGPREPSAVRSVS